MEKNVEIWFGYHSRHISNCLSIYLGIYFLINNFTTLNQFVIKYKRKKFRASKSHHHPLEGPTPLDQ